MTDSERKVYAVGHFSMIAMSWVLLGFFVYIGVMNELHPAPVLEACPQQVRIAK